ncbi:uncharacterized protein LOC117179109 [Belonocnema kinseyi]|uniref:uncharacterized protein LOC117179109 n=1 Tax=Belonocnema kinseyi TaxID=2817044 RepID=UPI00143DBC38|nr:uncharacterized protein LOC117179109 [Belonocnema kinseyi]
MIRINLVDLKEMIGSVPFFKRENGMTYEEKLAKIAEMNEFCENITKRDSHDWPEGYQQIVTSHLAWAATHEMLDYPPEIRERELLKFADQLFNDSVFRTKVDAFLFHRQYLSEKSHTATRPANATLQEEISHILFMMRVNVVSYEEKLAKVAKMRILCEKIIKRDWNHWSASYQQCAIDTFLLKALKILFNYPLEYIQFEIEKWASELYHNSNFRMKVNRILTQPKVQKNFSQLPFMKKDDGLSQDKKISVLTEINALTDKIIQRNWNSWPKGHHQFVSGTLIWNALDQLVDSSSQERQRVLLRWANELSRSSAFRKEVDSFLRKNPQHLPRPIHKPIPSNLKKFRF